MIVHKQTVGYPKTIAFSTENIFDVVMHVKEEDEWCKYGIVIRYWRDNNPPDDQRLFFTDEKEMQDMFDRIIEVQWVYEVK